MSEEKLDIEETTRYVNLGIPILVYSVNGKKIYYKLRTLTVEESKRSSTSEFELTHQLVPLTSDEMKAYGIEESSQMPVNGEPIEIEESQAQEEGEKKRANLTLSGDEAAVKAAKKILEERMAAKSQDPEKAELKQKLEEKIEEAEDFKNKLGLVAALELERKRKAVGAPPEIDTPEKLQGFIAAKESNKPKNEYGGVAPLNSYQYNGGQQQATDLAHRKFANINEAIATLQAERRNGNKEAADLLDKLWQKSIHDWKAAGHPAQMFSIDDNMEKTSGTPDVNFDNFKAQEELSEIARFGVKKSPNNYSKTHNAAGQKKGD